MQIKHGKYSPCLLIKRIINQFFRFSLFYHGLFVNYKTAFPKPKYILSFS
jgi:hypothetical protein